MRREEVASLAGVSVDYLGLCQRDGRPIDLADDSYGEHMLAPKRR